MAEDERIASMSEEASDTKRIQLSIRSLLFVTATVALLLVPVVWVVRERQRMLLAREDALRAVILSERQRSEIRERMATIRPAVDQARSDETSVGTSSPAPDQAKSLERLRRENSELKDTIEILAGKSRGSRARPDEGRKGRSSRWNGESPRHSPSSSSENNNSRLFDKRIPGPYDRHCYERWWPDVATCNGRQTGNPVRIRNGPAAVTECSRALPLFAIVVPVSIELRRGDEKARSPSSEVRRPTNADVGATPRGTERPDRTPHHRGTEVCAETRFHATPGLRRVNRMVYAVLRRPADP